MAEPLKNFFDAALVRSIASSLRAEFPRLELGSFVADCVAGLDALELVARGGRVAEVMRRHLPDDFVEAADIRVRSLGPELEQTDDLGLAPFRYLPHVRFVGRFGLQDFDAAMDAQYELTKRFSAEWSIRPFLVAHHDATYARLQRWARDPNVHVRRLVSEGTRPRLPWAPRLRAYQDDPAPVVALLELLKDGPERYVQRSVANSLNDIARDPGGPLEGEGRQVRYYPVRSTGDLRRAALVDFLRTAATRQPVPARRAPSGSARSRAALR